MFGFPVSYRYYSIVILFITILYNRTAFIYTFPKFVMLLNVDYTEIFVK